MRYRVQDADGDTDDRSFTITVEEQDSSLFLPPVGDRTYTQGTPISPWSLPAATGGIGTLTYFLFGIPHGLSINSYQLSSQWHIPGDSLEAGGNGL